MKLLLFCAAFALGVPVYARIGETETQLTQRFGRALNAEPHSVSSHGLVFEVGTSLTFGFGDWTINCDLIGGQCARIIYSKIGGWTEEDFQRILSANAQGGNWTDLLSPSVRQVTRKWKRDDGIIAHWVLGIFTLTSPLYERGVSLAEEKARAEKLAKDVKSS